MEGQGVRSEVPFETLIGRERAGGSSGLVRHGPEVREGQTQAPAVVSNLSASLGYTGRVVLGHTLNTLGRVITHTKIS